MYGSSRHGAAAGDTHARMLTLDVTDYASCQAAVAEVIRKEGRLDILVNNASFHCVGCQEARGWVHMGYAMGKQPPAQPLIYFTL